MRMLLLVVAASLTACSGLPPQPVVPLGAGEGVLGLTIDVPVDRNADPGLSIWAGVGAGRGVDLAVSIDAPLTLVSELGATGRGERPYVPPGILLRKSFESGAALGVGIASARTPFENQPPSRGLVQMTVGPFVSVGSPTAEAGVAGRASVHLVYQVQVTRDDSVSTSRRGLALFGVGAGGPVVAAEEGSVVFGGRVTAGTWLASPRAVGVTVGAFVEGGDALTSPR